MLHLYFFFADGAFVVDAFVFGLASRFFLPAAAFDGDAERDLLVEPVAVDDDDFFAFVEAPLAADFFFFGLAVFFATLDDDALFFVAVDADDDFFFLPPLPVAVPNLNEPLAPVPFVCLNNCEATPFFKATFKC